MKLVLASVWDTVAYANTIDCLAAMDGLTRDIALCLIIGRAYYGRPSDSIACTSELERIFQEVCQGQGLADDPARGRESDRDSSEWFTWAFLAYGNRAIRNIVTTGWQSL